MVKSALDADTFEVLRQERKGAPFLIVTQKLVILDQVRYWTLVRFLFTASFRESGESSDGASFVGLPCGCQGYLVSIHRRTPGHKRRDSTALNLSWC